MWTVYVWKYSPSLTRPWAWQLSSGFQHTWSLLNIWLLWGKNNLNRCDLVSMGCKSLPPCQKWHQVLVKYDCALNRTYVKTNSVFNHIALPLKLNLTQGCKNYLFFFMISVILALIRCYKLLWKESLTSALLCWARRTILLRRHSFRAIVDEVVNL